MGWLDTPPIRPLQHPGTQDLATAVPALRPELRVGRTSRPTQAPLTGAALAEYVVKSRPKLCVAVVGSQSPDRSLILAALLLDSIERHGWSERIEIVSIGFGAGAGAPDREALAAFGFASSAATCPDVDDDPHRLEASGAVVVATGEDADLLIRWPELEAKQVFVLSDYLGNDGWAISDPGAALSDYVSQVKEGVSHLLRALIARPE